MVSRIMVGRNGETGKDGGVFCVVACGDGHLRHSIAIGGELEWIDIKKEDAGPPFLVMVRTSIFRGAAFAALPLPYLGNTAIISSALSSF